MPETLAEIVRDHFHYGLREAERLIEFEQVTVDEETITNPERPIARPVKVSVTVGTRTRRKLIHEWGAVDV